MADYTIIADVSAYIVRLLREKMCPEPIPSPNHIEISSPTAQDVDYLVGLYLYEVKQETQIARPLMARQGRTQTAKAPNPYSLYYMVFINASSQMGLKAPDVQKIVGRIAQIADDNSSVFPRQLQPWLNEEEPAIVLSQARMALEEKVRVWQAINKPYEISLFYKAAPVFLSSSAVAEPPRVTQASIAVDLMERGS